MGGGSNGECGGAAKYQERGEGLQHHEIIMVVRGYRICIPKEWRSYGTFLKE